MHNFFNLGNNRKKTPWSYSVSTKLWSNLVSTRPNFFPASEKKVGRLGTRLGLYGLGICVIEYIESNSNFNHHHLEDIKSYHILEMEKCRHVLLRLSGS